MSKKVVLLLQDGQRKEVAQSPFRLGRDIELSHFVFASPVVSSLHAIITLPGAAGYSPAEVFALLGGPARAESSGNTDGSGEEVLAYITDMSTNGTWVNGQKIARGDAVPLYKGNTVALDPRVAKAGRAILESFVVQEELNQGEG